MASVSVINAQTMEKKYLQLFLHKKVPLLEDFGDEFAEKTSPDQLR